MVCDDAAKIEDESIIILIDLENLVPIIMGGLLESANSRLLAEKAGACTVGSTVVPYAVTPCTRLTRRHSPSDSTGFECCTYVGTYLHAACIRVQYIASHPSGG